MKSKKPETALQEIVNQQVQRREESIVQDVVARRAYFLYLNRGREDGHDIDDWLTAERELLSASHEENREEAA